MPRPEPHTIVRFKLRSLLAITLGVSLVMAVAGPYLRQLDAKQQQALLIGSVILALSGAAGVYHSVGRRKKARRQAGGMLLAVQLYSEAAKQFVRWSVLLLQLPVVVFAAYLLSRSFAMSTRMEFVTFSIIAVSVFFHGWILGKQFVSAWAEDFDDKLELRAHGLVVGERFHRWDASAIKDIYVRKLKQELYLNIKGFRRIVSLTDEQYKLARDILAEHYTRPKSPNPFA